MKNFDKICSVVAAYYNIPPHLMHAKTKKREIVDFRFMAMYILNKDFNISYNQLGKLFDKNHATIMNGVKELSGQLEMYKRKRVELSAIRSMVLIYKDEKETESLYLKTCNNCVFKIKFNS